jgi:hypothetical protein
MEVVAELHIAAGFVFEGRVEGQRMVQILIDAGVRLPVWNLLSGGSDGPIGGILRARGGREHPRNEAENKN